MELISHGDLAGYLANQAKPEREAQQIALQIVGGLKLMHKHGITHRDLKPQNIFIYSLSPTIQIKIGDFGISKRIAPQSTSVTFLRTRVYTPSYAAPEVIQLSDAYTSAVDLWALGCIVHEILMGCVPFPHPFALYSYCGGNQEALEPLANSSVSEAGVGFIKKLLAPQAGDRPTSGEAEELPWIEEAKRVAEFQDMSGPNRSADEEWKARFENLREEYEDLKKQAKYHLEAMQKQHQADLALGKRRLEEEEVRLEKLQEEHEHFKQQSEYRLEAMRKQHQADLALEQRRFKEEKEMLKFDHSKEILGNRMKKEKDETHSLRLELRHILEQYRAEKQQMEDHADDLANQLADMTRRYHAEKEKNMVKLEKSQREEVEKAKASSTLPQLRKEENAKPLKTLVVPTHTIHARDSRDRTTSRVTRSKPRLGGHGEMEVGWLYRIVGEYANEYSYDREITEIQRDTNTIITVDEEISRDGDEEYREVTIIGTEANRARAAERLHAEAY